MQFRIAETVAKVEVTAGERWFYPSNSVNSNQTSKHACIVCCFAYANGKKPGGTNVSEASTFLINRRSLLTFLRRKQASGARSDLNHYGATTIITDRAIEINPATLRAFAGTTNWCLWR